MNLPLKLSQTKKMKKERECSAEGFVRSLLLHFFIHFGKSCRCQDSCCCLSEEEKVQFHYSCTFNFHVKMFDA